MGHYDPETRRHYAFWNGFTRCLSCSFGWSLLSPAKRLRRENFLPCFNSFNWDYVSSYGDLSGALGKRNTQCGLNVSQSDSFTLCSNDRSPHYRYNSFHFNARSWRFLELIARWRRGNSSFYKTWKNNYKLCICKPKRNWEPWSYKEKALLSKDHWSDYFRTKYSCYSSHYRL